MERKPTYTIKEAVVALSTSETTFHRFVADGRIRVIKLGRKTLVTDDELNRLLREGIPTSSSAGVAA